MEMHGECICPQAERPCSLDLARKLVNRNGFGLREALLHELRLQVRRYPVGLDRFSSGAVAKALDVLEFPIAVAKISPLGVLALDDIAVAVDFEEDRVGQFQALVEDGARADDRV